MTTRLFFCIYNGMYINLTITIVVKVFKFVSLVSLVSLVSRHCRGEAINFTEIQMNLKRNQHLDGINHSERKVRAHQKLLNQSNTVFGLTDIRTSITVPVSIRLGWIPGLSRSHAVQVMIQVSRGTSLSEDR